jgi:pimeloyl-ACP methyl ester carboxylesterase
MPTPTAPSMRVGQGEPVLLLHGFAMSHHVWHGVASRLSERYDVYAVSMPGHWGGPPLARSQVSVAGYADGVERMLDEAGWDRCHVVGNSLGGWVAFELERRGRARSVVAIAPAGGWHPNTFAAWWIALKFALLYPVITLGRLLGERAHRIGFARTFSLRIITRDRRAVARADAENCIRAAVNCRAYLATLWGMRAHGGIHHLGTVRAPTRLVLCEHDALLPVRHDATRFATELPGARAVTLPGVGHVPMLEDPELIAQVIREHLETAGGPSTPQ